MLVRDGKMSTEAMEWRPSILDRVYDYSIGITQSGSVEEMQILRLPCALKHE